MALRALLASLFINLCSHAARLDPKSDERHRINNVLLYPRPSHDEHAEFARWLVHETTWGTLSTLDAKTGEPIGGVLSHSDGAPDAASGRLFFYITPMDELTQNVLAHPRCSYTVSEVQDPAGGGPCPALDPEDPACSRATLLGRMQRVSPGEEGTAREAVFARHPRMADWPAGHKFELWELVVEEVHLLDWYGGMAYVGAEEYYGASLAH